MYFEQDYILRLIRQIVRFIIKLLLKIDIDHPDKNLVEDEEARSILEELCDMIDEGRVNEAENRLYENLNGVDASQFLTATLFYSYLNEKDDTFLAKHQYTREEIKEGLLAVSHMYGLNGIVEALVEEQ